ncbi:MAG: DUF692 domain-containing protein [Gammaproteobacteria bacterium]|nr:DUF692 domain-containing protein [Gammaproteobacteria bacterium]
MNKNTLSGTGLSLKRDFLDDYLECKPEQLSFIEVAPENWMTMGGELGEKFAHVAKSSHVVLHGLSLSLGGPEALDEYFLHRVHSFMQEHQIEIYTEHLSYCSDDGHLYDLMPIPFTQEAVNHVVDRIKKVQDITGKQFAIENISYYAAPMQKIPEIDFLNAIIEKSDCQLLLDINNVYVNSINHCYDAFDFIKQIPEQRIVYCHIAGHYQEDVDLIIDTHGADIVDPVWQLLQQTYECYGALPTLLERDFNIPPLKQLLLEVDKIADYQKKYGKQAYAA